MAGLLLFCVAEQAKTLIPQVLKVGLGNEHDVSFFYLVESKKGPTAEDGRFRRSLGDDETPNTEDAFIGASAEDCQAWAVQQQQTHKFITQDLIAVADGRTAKDETLAIWFYNTGEGLPFGRYGTLPEKADAWYEFRINYREAAEVYASLTEGAFDCVYPVYFGNKAKLTDKNGVFDAAKAERLVGGEDMEVLKI